MKQPLDRGLLLVPRRSEEKSGTRLKLPQMFFFVKWMLNCFKRPNKSPQHLPFAAFWCTWT